MTAKKDIPAALQQIAEIFPDFPQDQAEKMLLEDSNFERLMEKIASYQFVEKPQSKVILKEDEEDEKCYDLTDSAIIRRLPIVITEEEKQKKKDEERKTVKALKTQTSDKNKKIIGTIESTGLQVERKLAEMRSFCESDMTKSSESQSSFVFVSSPEFENNEKTEKEKEDRFYSFISYSKNSEHEELEQTCSTSDSSEWLFFTKDSATNKPNVYFKYPNRMQTSSRDWIGLFIHDREISYNAWDYTNMKRLGCIEFPMQPNGFYDARLYLNGTKPVKTVNVELLKSVRFLVGPEVLIHAILHNRRIYITFAYPNKLLTLNHNDSIELFPSNCRSNRTSIDKVIPDFSSNQQIFPLMVPVPETTLFSVSFPSPQLPGDYVVRFFLDQNHRSFSGCSPNIHVPNENTLSCSVVKKRFLHAKYNLPSCVPSAFSVYWIGIYNGKNFLNLRDYLLASNIDISTTAEGEVVFDLTTKPICEVESIQVKILLGRFEYVTVVSSEVIVLRKVLL